MADTHCKFCRRAFVATDLIRFLTIEVDPEPYRYATVLAHDDDLAEEYSGWGHEACIAKVLALKPLDWPGEGSAGPDAEH